MGRKKKMFVDGKDANDDVKTDTKIDIRNVPRIEAKKLSIAPKTIEDILKFRGQPYATFSRAEYAAGLKLMGTAELQDECHKHGLLPSQRDDVLRERLLDQFDKWVGGINASQHAPKHLKESTLVKKMQDDVFGKAII
ncbi:MAG: hypothetical protein AABY22_22345 [Nanoarchaeota archaeon]